MMFRRSIFGFAAVAVVMFVTGLTAFGQIAITSGRIELVKEDGSREGVGGAVIEVYRTDAKGTFPTGKSGKKGDFSFAGFVIGGVYALSVSAPNCAPKIFPNVRAGQEKIVIDMTPGDGRKWTEAEVRTAIAGGLKAGAATSTGGSGKADGDTAPQMSEEDKKKKAAYEADVKRISAENDKKLKANETVGVSLKAANEAFNAGMASYKAKDLPAAIASYSTAISKYDEGIAADPDFVGTAPVLLNNRGTALRQRAVANFNKSVKETDSAVKIEGYAAVQKDLLESAESYNRAYSLLSKATSTDFPDPKQLESFKADSARGGRDTFGIAVQTEKVDPALIEVSKSLIPEFLKFEADATKKIEAQLIIADLYRIVQDRENAISSYKAVLVASPDNLEATGYLGLVLVDLSWLKENDKPLAQEGANYLQKFVAVAPDTHKLKEGAKGYLDILKTQSIVPVKTPAGTKKKP